MTNVDKALNNCGARGTHRQTAPEKLKELNEAQEPQRVTDSGKSQDLTAVVKRCQEKD